MTITIHLWHLLAYLGVGVFLLVPLNYWAHRQIHNPGPFWKSFFRSIRMFGWKDSLRMLVMQVTLWPVAVWETFRG